MVSFCEPNWKCSGWGECQADLMTRKCYDENHCEYSYNKPIETTGCDLSKALVADKKPFNWLFLFIGIIMALILIIVLISLLDKR